MAMIIAIPKERRAEETRVAAVPETVKKFKGLGLDVVVETSAGAAARFSDADYAAAGASIAPDATSAVRNADIVLKVRAPSDDEIALLKRGAVLAALLSPTTEKAAISRLAEAGVTAFAMEFLPRISRAQAMDVRVDVHATPETRPHRRTAQLLAGSLSALLRRLPTPSCRCGR